MIVVLMNLIIGLAHKNASTLGNVKALECVPEETTTKPTDGAMVMHCAHN